MQKRNSTILPVIQALMAALLFGASAPLSKLLLHEIDPLALAGLLYLGAGIGSWLLFGFRSIKAGSQRTEARLSKEDLPWLAGAILAGGVAAPVLLMFSLKQTPGSTASLLLNFEAVATAMLAFFLFKEAVARRVWMAVIAITVACILLSWNGGEWGFSFGSLGIIGACFLWGLDNNFSRRFSGKDPLFSVGIKGLAAGSFSFLLVLLLGRPMASVLTVALALLVGALSYGLSLQLFMLALRGLGAARTGALFGIAPFMGAGLSFLVLREAPSWLFWIALPLMAAGAWLMLTESHGHYHVHEPLEHEHAHTHADEHHQHEHPQGEMPEGAHSHLHTHESQSHSHVHAPDLHHRHSHEESDADH